MEPELRQAQAALLAGDFEQALRCCNDLLSRIPGHPEAWTQRAEVLQLLGRSEEASAASEQAERMRKAPAPPKVQMARGGVSIVRRLGSTYTAMGWALALINFLCFVFAAIVLARAVPVVADNREKYEGNPQAMEKLLGSEFMAVSILSYGVWMLTLLWLTLDLGDREAPWPWMVGGTLFGMLCIVAPYCGPGWLLLPLYLLLGRRKS